MYKPGIAAYFQCWRHPHATITSVRHYRAAYPDNTLYLLSDNGHDYSELAKEYNCIYEHSTLVHGGFPSFTRVEDIKLFLDRFSRALDTMEEEWVLLLEDDTKVFAPYSMELLKCHMNGTIVGHPPHTGNRLRSQQINDFIRLFNPFHTNDPLYSGWGGCVLHIPFFKAALAKNPYPLIEYLWKYNPTEKLYVTDLVLSFVCFLNNGTIGDLYQHAGDLNWVTPHTRCVNTDKSWCSMPLDEDEKHLVKLLH